MRSEPSSSRRQPSSRLSGFCESSSGLLVLVLASTAVALCLTLVDIAGFADFWPVFGLNSVFIVGIAVAATAMHCHWAAAFGRRRRLSEPVVFFVVTLLVVLAASLAVLAARPVLAPLDLLAHASPGFFLFRNMLFALVAGFTVSRYLALQDRWRSQVAAESRARLDSLQSRIRPHFLFNALNTISSLIHDRPDQAEQATMDLSDLLRTGLKENSHHSLGEELDLVRGYLRIESLRLGDRLAVDWALDDDLPMDLQLPALLIQPLVENGVVHGIARLSGGGTLQIRAGRYRRRRLRFVIENPVPADEPDPAEGNRMALDNIRQRLELAYEEGARLRTWREDGRFHVELIVPV